MLLRTVDPRPAPAMDRQTGRTELAIAMLYPVVNACTSESWVNEAVELAALPERMARPTAPPICWEVVISPEARPPWRAGTPEVAAAYIGAKVIPYPTGITSMPGSTWSW